MQEAQKASQAVAQGSDRRHRQMPTALGDQAIDVPNFQSVQLPTEFAHVP